MFEKIYYRLPLKLLDMNEQYVTLKGYKTVAVILTELLPKGSGAAEFEMHLLISPHPADTAVTKLRMNPDRTLSSYRIKESDKLMITKITSEREQWKQYAGDEEKIVVIVRCPHNFISKTLKFHQKTKLRTVRNVFIQKAKLFVAPCMYNMYYFDASNQQQRMDDELPLSAYEMPTPARLTCELRPRSATKLFGVDASTLPMTTDLGCQVPEILMILREMLEVKNGLISEGVFRKAGSELEMKVVKEKLENAEFVQAQDIHSVATLIKRWFKELPSRMLVGLEYGKFNTREMKLSIFNHLSPCYSSMLLWLFRLILVTVRNKDTSLMDPKNLGLSSLHLLHQT